MAVKTALGIQDFGKIIEDNCFYVDKTYFIKEWWENGDAVTLITRPRRFGKTLAMSMMDYFFSIRHPGRSDLFEGLSIWKEPAYRKLQGTWPVIFLSFAAVKGNRFETAREMLCQQIVNLYTDSRFLLEEGFLAGEDAAFFQRISVTMNDAAAAESIGQLSRFLCQYYGKKVIILLDEYDTPMQEAYVNGYWEEMSGFIGRLFHAAFKTNPYLERGIMTGITRVGRESVFSDLNNLTVVTAASCMYETAFGFTREEVLLVLEDFGLMHEKEEVRRWYDGFRFGNCGGIYNPWSILNFLKFREFSAYWANTSSNKLIGDLIRKGNTDIKTSMEDLMNGKQLCAALDEQIVFSQPDMDSNAVWSLFLASGYLKITGSRTGRKGRKEYFLDIVNLEVRVMFENLFSGWFAPCRPAYSRFIKALLENDTEGMNGFMNELALAVVSSFDTGKHPSERAQPESFYHGLVLGIMTELDGRYVLASNRESGYGRYDVMLEPKDVKDDGIIFEFKVWNGKKEESLEDTVHAALRQIMDKKYAKSLENKGVLENKIRIYGLAFRGKEVLIDGGYLEDMLRETASW